MWPLTNNGQCAAQPDHPGPFVVWAYKGNQVTKKIEFPTYDYFCEGSAMLFENMEPGYYNIRVEWMDYG